LTGAELEPSDPDPEEIELLDIATSLSKEPRFNALGDPAISVGLHSLAVQKFLERMDEEPLVQIYGLLHDAHETYTGDTPGMMKTPDQRAREDILTETIYEAFDIPLPEESHERKVGNADDVSLLTEVFLKYPREDFDHKAASTDVDAMTAEEAVYSMLDLYSTVEDTPENFISTFEDLRYRVKE
jgi:hypothetical protein